MTRFQIRYVKTLNRILPLFVFLCAAAVYISTTSTELTWAYHGTDGGELITAVVTRGIPHPPGYPTYLLLSRLFSHLPLGSMAYRFNLFSAVCMAGSAAFLTALIQTHIEQKSWYLSVSIGLTFAFMPLIWSQAIITEVYALNLLLIATALWAHFASYRPPIVGVLVGLALTTHLTSALLLPYIYFKTPPREWVKLSASIAIGLLPFLLLPLWVQLDSPVIWGNPHTLSGWWWLVSAQIYRPNLFSASNLLLQQRVVSGLYGLATQLGYLGWLLVAFSCWYKRPNMNTEWPLIGSIFLFVLYAWGYNTPDAAVFLLPSLLLLNILLAKLLKPVPQLAVLLPLLLLTLNFRGFSTPLNPNGDATQAVSIIQQLPDDALILTASGGLTIFTMWYFHHVENYRPDLMIVDEDLFAFDWYRAHLKNQYPTLIHINQDNLDKFTSENLIHRSICQLTLKPIYISCLKQSH